MAAPGLALAQSPSLKAAEASLVKETQIKETELEETKVEQGDRPGTNAERGAGRNTSCRPDDDDVFSFFDAAVLDFWADKYYFSSAPSLPFALSGNQQPA